MGENASQIEREIMAERSELGRNLDVLETRAREMANWRVHYRNHPGVFLGAAAGLGLALGALSVRNHPPQFGYGSYARTPEPPRPQRPRRSLTDRLHSPKGRKLVETWEHVTDALMSVATAKAVDLVSAYLPGFSEEYRRHTDQGGQGGFDGRDNTSWQTAPAGTDMPGRTGFESSGRSNWYPDREVR